MSWRGDDENLNLVMKSSISAIGNFLHLTYHPIGQPGLAVILHVELKVIGRQNSLKP